MTVPQGCTTKLHPAPDGERNLREGGGVEEKHARTKASPHTYHTRMLCSKKLRPASYPGPQASTVRTPTILMEDDMHLHYG